MRLRGERVHELDIMQLLGHSSLGVTAGYAHGTPTVIQNAVDKLAEPRGEVVEFARREVQDVVILASSLSQGRK